MSIVQYSTSINSSFISTVDHLPLDIVRSLWLVQSLNIKIEKYRRLLHNLLLDAQACKIDRETLRARYIRTSNTITALQLEAIQETKALYNQVVTHKWVLTREAEQLARIKNNLINSDATNENLKGLREKLRNHYKEHPLRSQREALKEQELKRKPQTDLGPGGLKIRLKLSPSTLKKKVLPSIQELPTRPNTSLRQRRAHKLEPAPHKLKTKVPRMHKVRGRKAKVKGSKINRSKNPAKSLAKHKLAQDNVIPINNTVLLAEEDNHTYCFCKQASFGNMIACDNEDTCPNGEWFHYKCIGLLNRVDALKFTSGQEKWFCSDFCRQQYASKPVMKPASPKKTKRRRRHNK